MSPARIAEQARQDQQVETLTRGFDALLETARSLALKEQDLQLKLKFAHDEYLQLANSLPVEPDPSIADTPRRIVPGDPAWGPQSKNPEVPTNNSEWLDDLSRQGHAEPDVVESIRKGLEAQVSLVGRLEARNGNSSSNPCLVAAKAKGMKSLERDFTTNGVQGNLHCPFAKTTDGKGGADDLAGNKNDACGRDYLDPIKAESRQGKSSCPSVSARSSAARCPIRYLNQHSPEEVAKYFENHKHEIPRSHAVCVKRYSKDFQGARQLDAKYGSMVNMIQGLGEKHQAFLPSGGEEEPSNPNPVPSKRVEQWAEDVNATPPSQGTDQAQDGDNHEEERKSHFDRPLREVRVGESPSRPWGISVPVPLEPALQIPPSTSGELAPASAGIEPPDPADHVGNGGTHPSPANHLPETKGFGKSEPRGCPFSSGALKYKQEDSTEDGHLAVEPEPDIDTHEREDFASNEDMATPRPQGTPPPSQPQPNVVFNGPVFLGYSAVEAAALIQQLGNPNSQAIRANNQVYVSGQIPADASGNLIEGTVGQKTTQCCDNIAAVLAAAGSSVAKIVKVNVFLTDMGDFAEMNAEYEKFFTHKPARSCVAVHQLPKGVPVEIECIALQ
ncbi:hypothetical protein FQN54_006858 [Arachnomyces sp. PD_36]|nr:hypothetical protein FQN54_006858 [Arachnomyces sp. PD_36]